MSEGASAGDANFVENMRAAREARGWTQAQLADAVRAAGVETNQSAVSRMEKGDRDVKLAEARALAKVFGTSMETMFWTPDQFEKVLAWNKVSGDFQDARRTLVAAARRYEGQRREVRDYLYGSGAYRGRFGYVGDGRRDEIEEATGEDSVQVIGPMLPLSDHNPLGFVTQDANGRFLDVDEWPDEVVIPLPESLPADVDVFDQGE